MGTKRSVGVNRAAAVSAGTAARFKRPAPGRAALRTGWRRGL